MNRHRLFQWLVTTTGFAGILLSAAALNAQEIKGEPPFMWDSAFATPDTALALEETNRTPPGAPLQAIFYRVKATGFSANEPISLWVKRGVRYLRFEGTVADEGVVQFSLGPNTLSAFMVILNQRDRGLATVSLSKGDTKGLVLAGFTDGHPLDVALVSGNTMKRAHAKVTPIPVRVDGTNGCSASAELQSETGLLFLVNLTGFVPGEEVQVLSQYKKEAGRVAHTASPSGTLSFPVLFGRGDSGTASLTATTERCAVKLEYKVGNTAIVR
jgi:hypothetical protein